MRSLKYFLDEVTLTHVTHRYDEGNQDMCEDRARAKGPTTFQG